MIRSGDLDLLLPDPPPAGDSWRWGTVTATSPLRVRLDGDGAALDVTPDSLVPISATGGRVLCQILGRRVIVHGGNDRVDITSGLAMAASWTLVAGLGRRQSGHVSIQFLADKTTAWVNGESVFTLPSGSRPLVDFGVGCEQGNGGTVGPAVLLVQPSGQVLVFGQTGNNKQVRGSIEFNV